MTSKSKNPIRIAVTPGEPAGIGPDIVIQLAQQGCPHELIVYASSELLTQRARQLGLSLTLRKPGARPAPLQPGELCIQEIPLNTDCVAGELNPVNAGYVLETLHTAATDCLQQSVAALVTGPVNKAVINDAGIAFSGHTEFFAELSNTPRVVMMLASANLKVALATTHLPLREVPDAINANLLDGVLRILRRELQRRFKLADPRILVCGLNPHAGEGGHLGTEEQTIIAPLLQKLRGEGFNLIGPSPADTAFTPTQLAHCDAVLAMYHDQGLPVLKYQGFGTAVNITLGLPFVRTSVDHGTALDLAGSGTADTGSLASAIDYAIQMAPT